jgi:hypothetical protein
MPTLRLQPDTNVRLAFTSPSKRWVTLELEADHPVESYIVRPKGLEVFDEGRVFKYYGGFARPRKRHYQELRLPFEGPWYLLIVNRSHTEPARVRYKVSY